MAEPSALEARRIPWRGGCPWAGRLAAPLLLAGVVFLGPARSLVAQSDGFVRNVVGAGEAFSIAETPDGGYAVAGARSVLRVDGRGNTVFHRRYGDSRVIEGFSVTADGGFVLTGRTTGSYLAGDLWIAKLDASGEIEWERAYFGDGSSVSGPRSVFLGESGKSVIEVRDDTGQPAGYAVAGWTTSFGSGYGDLWVLRVDRDGDPIWSRALGTGAARDESARDLVQASTGELVVTGIFGSLIWVLKLDPDGKLLWQHHYRGSHGFHVQSMVASADGGFAVTGSTSEFGAGSLDAWLLKLDANGNPVWLNAYGGSSGDRVSQGFLTSHLGGDRSLVQTPDGGYALTGSTASFGAGEDDAWLFKVSPDGETVEWSRSYGGEGNDEAHSVLLRSGGGFAFAGGTTSFGSTDALIALLDGEGNAPRCGLIGTNAPAVTQGTPRMGTPGIGTDPTPPSVRVPATPVSELSAFNEQQCPFLDSDADGTGDSQELKFGTDPDDAASYPVKKTVETFARSLINTRRRPPLIEEKPSVRSTLSVVDQDGNSVTVRNEAGRVVSTPRSGRAFIIPKSAGMRQVTITATSRLVMGGTRREVTASRTDDLAALAAYPGENANEIVFRESILITP